LLIEQGVERNTLIYIFLGKGDDFFLKWGCRRGNALLFWLWGDKVRKEA
jgi:hypothetical protein